MIDETAKSVVAALLQYGVLGIVTVMLVAWLVILQRRNEALQKTIEESYREQVESIRASLERTITSMERSTSALAELAKVEEGRIVEIRGFYETLRRMLEDMAREIDKLLDEQTDKLKAAHGSTKQDVLSAIQALRADVIATLDVLRRR